ncbi:hypothetical protein WDZ16_10435 [Pseudokineococcus marinus]|uniref:hypothetical protein n=1 Tax=Pseudokineococcus marinus TaxID=351215 RepID=UPI0030A37D51
MAGAAAVSVAWCLALLLVIDPWFTVTRDISALYSRGAGGSSFFLWIIGILVAAGVLAWLVAVVLVATLAGKMDSGQRRSLGIACATGVVGTVMMVTTLLYGPVSFAQYHRAEDLGIAPPTGSISPAAVATLVIGIVALVAAAVVGGKASQPTAETRPRTASSIAPTTSR